MREQIGLNFAAALRSFLRQDPNIILVGEIRDLETPGDRHQSVTDGASGVDLRDSIAMGASAIELKKQAFDGGMITLRRSGLFKVRDQLTTIEEVLRETVG